MRSNLPVPSIDCERALWSGGIRWVAGVDEVGRGALAGPVVAAAVVWSRDLVDRHKAQDGSSPWLPATLPESFSDIRDSKLLEPAVRCRLAAEIESMAAAVGIGWVPPSAVDGLGIAKATALAMRRAIRALPVEPEWVLVDGLPVDLGMSQCRAIVGGDRSVLSISAASIVAKVHRDAYMIALSETCQGYGLERHKGYGTRRHLEALQRRGPSVHHRLSWAPVRLAWAMGKDSRRSGAQFRHSVEGSYQPIVQPFDPAP